MASKYQCRQQWWVKFRDPRTGTLIRESLETTDEARAELLRQRLDLEVALLEPHFKRLKFRCAFAPIGRPDQRLPILWNEFPQQKVGIKSFVQVAEFFFGVISGGRQLTTPGSRNIGVDMHWCVGTGPQALQGFGVPLSAHQAVAGTWADIPLAQLEAAPAQLFQFVAEGFLFIAAFERQRHV